MLKRYNIKFSSVSATGLLNKFHKNCTPCNFAQYFPSIEIFHCKYLMVSILLKYILKYNRSINPNYSTIFIVLYLLS